MIDTWLIHDWNMVRTLDASLCICSHSIDARVNMSIVYRCVWTCIDVGVLKGRGSGGWGSVAYTENDRGWRGWRGCCKERVVIASLWYKGGYRWRRKGVVWWLVVDGGGGVGGIVRVFGRIDSSGMREGAATPNWMLPSTPLSSMTMLNFIFYPLLLFAFGSLS